MIFLWEFLTGLHDQPNRTYGPYDLQTIEMQHSIGAQKLRDAYKAKGCKNTTFEYKTLNAWWDTLANPMTYNWFSTAAQVGGFGNATACGNGCTVTYTIPNVAGLHSFGLHVLNNRKSPTGPMSTITQTFQWTEPCPCK